VPTSAGTATGGAASTGGVITADFVADWTDVNQTIEGFGGSDSYYPDIDSALLDALYCVNATDPGCANPGIGLTILRSVITTTGTTQSGDWLNQQGVVARGGECWGIPWNVAGCTPGTALPTTSYLSWAETLASWATGAADAGVAVYAISVQNEPDYNGNGDCLYTSAQMAAFIDVFGPVLHGLSDAGLDVKVMGPDTSEWPDFDGDYRPTIEADPVANAQTDIFTTHQYTTFSSGAVADGTRSMWETEMSAFDTFDPSIANAVNEVSTWIYDAVATYGVNAWHYWWLIMPVGATNGDNEGLIGQGGSDTATAPTMTKRYFAMGNWSRYVRPGMVRLGVTGSFSGLYGVAAFKDPTTGSFVLVAINDSGADLPQVTFGLSGASVTGSVTPYVTSGTPLGALGTDGNLSAGSVTSSVPATLPVSGGVFTSIVPYGVTTFVGTAQ
jgi:O-glycosyl hydrolase